MNLFLGTMTVMILKIGPRVLSAIIFFKVVFKHIHLLLYGGKRQQPKGCPVVCLMVRNSRSHFHSRRQAKMSVLERHITSMG